MKIFFYIFLIICSAQYYTQAANAPQKDLGATNVISFFLKEYPEKNDFNNINKTIKECNILNNHFQTICQSYNISHNFAVFSTYAGYLSMSNTNGQISFPRKVINNSINLLISNKISPVFMFGATIAFWEIQDPTAKMYFLERSQDPTTKLFYWEAKEKPLPASNRVPVQTIVIIADPKEIYVPLGATLTRSSSNLLLPDIYVKKDIDSLANVLFVLNIKPFFSRTNQIFKEIPIGYESLVVA